MAGMPELAKLAAKWLRMPQQLESVEWPVLNFIISGIPKYNKKPASSIGSFEISETTGVGMGKLSSQARSKDQGAEAVDLPQVQPVKALLDIGAQIRAARQRDALRIDDAASLCGVSVDLLSRLENGKGSVGTDKVLRVMAGLGLELFVAPKGHVGMRALVLQELSDG